MDDRTARERFTAARFAVLGTVDPLRGTHVVPVVFAMAHDQLVIPIDTVKRKKGTALRRVTNLERDPRASILVDGRSEDWHRLWWVRADLTYVGHTGVDDVVMAALAAKYDAYAAPGSVDSVLRLSIGQLVGWSAT